MKVNGIKIRKKAMEYLHGMMVKFIKASGKIIIKMDMVK